MHLLRLLFPWLLGVSAASAQDGLHPYLVAKLEQAQPGAKLPVYFVLRERLGHAHWFPRVQGLPLRERRALVIAELRAQARESQAGLLESLWEMEEEGRAERIFSNWVGNFVQVRATAEVIVELAGREEVEQAWFDASFPRREVEDGTLGPVVSSAGGPSVIGDGPAAVNAAAVWDRGFRGQGVLIMNADSGLNVQHGDLINRIWHNPGEIPGNGRDDDGNGLVDDVHGWNYAGSDGDLDDYGGHGTAVAGAIVGDGSCTGVVCGPAPEAMLMGALLNGETSQWNAVQYAIEMGADMMNSAHSYKLRFDPPPNYRMHREIGDVSLAAGLIRTNSTSNDGRDCDADLPSGKPCNVAAPGNVPPPYIDPNQSLQGKISGVLGVAAWDFRRDILEATSPCGPFGWSLADVLARRPDYDIGSWSSPQHDDYPWSGGQSVGLLKPDIAAPSRVSTTAGPGAGCGTTLLSGTSAASPITMGVIALWKSANPSLTPEDVGMIVHQTALDRGAVPGKDNDWGAGVIDALAGLKLAQCVHRVDGQTVWELEHRVGEPITLQVDGIPSAPAVIAVGVVRQTVDLGPLDIGIGSTIFTVWAGSTDTEGQGGPAPLPLDPALVGVKVYTQAVILDRSRPGEFRPRASRVFPLGEVLTSNVIGIQLTL